MKLWQLYVIGAWIFIAPNMSERARQAVAFACIALALLGGLIEPFFPLITELVKGALR